MDSALPTMTIQQASERWIEWRRPYTRGRTIETYETFFKALIRFFQEIRLNEIKPGHLREYQRMRAINADNYWKRTAGVSVINHELNALAQLLEYAGLWQALKPFYRPLPSKRWQPPRVLTPDQEAKLFEIAATDPELELAYLVASITNNTSAAGTELRNLQIKHVDLLSEPPSVVIPGDITKNDVRGRLIPLNATAAKQFDRAVRRANKLGCTSREHFLFPFRVKRNSYDPTRPASRYWLRSSFNKLRVAADMPDLRPHDLRHQAITRMLETGAPENTVMSIAGHVSKQMLDHYSHTRIDAKMAVVRAVEPGSFRVAGARRFA